MGATCRVCSPFCAPSAPRSAKACTATFSAGGPASISSWRQLTDFCRQCQFTLRMARRPEIWRPAAVSAHVCHIVPFRHGSKIRGLGREWGPC